MNSRMQEHRGFTLLELSIVLIIIGLIVGGVLVGRDLIEAAQIRSTISKLEHYNTATNTFRLKYNSIPGDAHITGYTVNADRNGQICGWYSHYGVTERWAYYLGLKEAGLSSFSAESLASADSSMDNVAIGGRILVTAPMSGGADLNCTHPYHYFYLSGWYCVGDCAPPGENAYMRNIYSPSVAYRLDSKIDDGLPLVGNVVAVEPGPATWAPNYYGLLMHPTALVVPAASGSCVSDASGNPYAMTQTDPLCTLRIRSAF